MREQWEARVPRRLSVDRARVYRVVGCPGERERMLQGSCWGRAGVRGMRPRPTEETALREGGQGLGPGKEMRVCVPGTRVDSGHLWASDPVQNRRRSKRKS